MIILNFSTFQKTIRKDKNFDFISKYLKIAFEISFSFHVPRGGNRSEHSTRSGKWNKNEISKAILKYLEMKSKFLSFLNVFWNVEKFNIINNKKFQFFVTSETRTSYLWVFERALYQLCYDGPTWGKNSGKNAPKKFGQALPPPSPSRNVQI